MTTITERIYKTLLALACVAMVVAFLSVLLGIIGRQIDWNLPGLDAYAGYAIAAVLFLALPASFRHGDHIRVTLLLRSLPPRAGNVFEYACLVAALLLALGLAWFSARLVWVSYSLHDVSPAADATPMWIPQLTMATGCAGFVLALGHALLARWRGTTYFDTAGSDAEHAE